MVKKRKLKWYGHISRSSGMTKTILQGTVEGARRRGRQKKRWEDNIKEWTGMGFGFSEGSGRQGMVESYCCNVICGAPTTSKVKGLRWNPGRFAHFPVRPWVVSPTFPFAPSRFAPGSFRPLSRSHLSRFAHFPVRPWVVSPPYKILFLVLLFRPQKWYKSLIFLLIDDFAL